MSKRKSTSQGQTLDIWGGYCQLDDTDPKLSPLLDLHGVCRFCLLARGRKDAAAVLDRAAILHYSFLTPSKSAVERAVAENIMGTVFLCRVEQVYLAPHYYHRYPYPDPPSPLRIRWSKGGSGNVSSEGVKLDPLQGFPLGKVMEAIQYRKGR